MAKKKKSTLGSQGPQPHWLRMSPAERAKTKQYIKESLLGYTRDDGIHVPGVRRIYSGFEAGDGYDLRHIERWPASRLKSARTYAQSLNTLTGRPFKVLTPRSKKQKKSAQTFTGQNLARQKQFIVTVQDPKRDHAVFRNNKVSIERDFAGGTKTIKQRYLFADYLERGEREPIGFAEMLVITKRMLPEMPDQIRKNSMYYTLTTRQYGPIGESVRHRDILELLEKYYHAYESRNNQHEGFAEQVIGFTSVGNILSAKSYDAARENQRLRRRQMSKLRFSKRVRKRR